MNALAIFKMSKLLFLELTLLSLMIISLPSFEAPKNIFLVFFVIVAVIRQFKKPTLKVWDSWDWMFLAIIISAFLSTIFAGLSPGDEWKGFRVLVTCIGVGWLVSRSKYSSKELSWIFWVTLLSVIPPLAWGLYSFLVLHSNYALQLHSVGHVNHSAIYLTMIFAACLGSLFSLWLKFSNLQKWALLFLTLILYASLFVGQSRAAVGVGTGLILLFTLTLSSNSRLKIGTLVLSIFIFILSTFFAGGVVDKQLKNQEAHDVLSGRSRIWNVTLEVAKLYPVFGIGIDNRAVVTREVIKNSIESRHGFFDESNYDFRYKHSHSFYLTNIAERGVVGFVITLFFIFMWLWQLFKTYYLTKQSGQAAYLWAGSMGAWMTTFGIGFVNTTFHHEHGILAYLFLGLYLSYCKSHAKV